MAKVIGEIGGGRPIGGGGGGPTLGGGGGGVTPPLAQNDEPTSPPPQSQESILEEIMNGTYGKLKGQKDDINPRLTMLLKTMHSLLMKAIVMSTSTQVSTTNPIPEPMQRFQGEEMPDLNDD